MIELRDYQVEISKKGLSILKDLGILYLAMEVRTGKTFTALDIAEKYGAKSVLFATKKKAIETGTIKNDYDALECSFAIEIINNESLHKVSGDYDLVISDEHHRNSAYPKPNKTAKLIKERFGHLPMIFLSGTPAIESGSQWYHSFWVSKRNPFSAYKNFYAWAKTYTIPKTRHLGALKIPDYSDSIDELIMPIIEPYLLKYTQKEAGFVAEIKEHILLFDMSAKTRSMISELLKNQVLVGSEDSIVADTPVKLMNKVHQMSNGTVILESGATIVLDTVKAEFVKKYFIGKKIAIFYYFQKEREILLSVFGDAITTDINEFNSGDKNFCIQQISGSEAISLKAADSLVYYNFGYSGKNFTQGRDRMTTKEREENNVYFVMSKNDINSRIYKAVKSKKRYNEKLFIKDFYGSRANSTNQNKEISI